MALKKVNPYRCLECGQMYDTLTVDPDRSGDGHIGVSIFKCYRCHTLFWLNTIVKLNRISDEELEEIAKVPGVAEMLKRNITKPEDGR